MREISDGESAAAFLDMELRGFVDCKDGGEGEDSYSLTVEGVEYLLQHAAPKLDNDEALLLAMVCLTCRDTQFEPKRD